MSMMVPSDLAALDGSPLFSATAKAAYSAELNRADELRSSIPDQDESVADFVLRHFGAEVLDRVAAPLLSGVFGGDVRTLSVRAVMPAFVTMERDHGSLIAALQAKGSVQPAPDNLHPATIFTTLRTGLGTLVDRLVAAIPPSWLRLNTSVTRITPPPHDEATWGVSFRNHGGAQLQTSESFDAVFLATSLDSSRRLLGHIDADAASLLPTESSSAVLVAFCYPDATRVPVPPGFGFLVPPRQSSDESAVASLLLACTFVDQKFPHRVPPGGRMVRAFFGGAAADRLTRCGNDEIAAIARLELARILNTAVPLSAAAPTPAPVAALTVVRRWPNSLPQYTIGHLDRVARLESRLLTLPGLTLLGNALHGVGLPDLVRDARAAAKVQGVGSRE
jgi:oxygen-dependent protoporphyrinogen oxidase